MTYTDLLQILKHQIVKVPSTDQLRNWNDNEIYRSMTDSPTSDSQGTLHGSAVRPSLKNCLFAIAYSGV